MKGHLSVDTPVAAPASWVWDVYRGVELARVVTELLSDVVGKAEVVEGDGGVGTIVKLTFPPGAPGGGGYMKEIFKIMDDENRVKQSEVIEGGMKDVGFQQYRFRFDIIEKDADTSIIRSSVDYEIEDSNTEAASLATTKPLEVMAETIGKYIVEKKST